MARILCEPQLMIVWAVSCAAFALFAGHKSYLLLIPIHTLAALLPTVIDVIRYWDKGAWHRIFMDEYGQPAATRQQQHTSLLSQIELRSLSPRHFTGAALLA